jgi:hypothetical protein
VAPTDARAPRQHDAARALLTKYSHEKTYRLRDALAAPADAPLPEIEAVQSTIPEAPGA